jgi:ribulose-5-phosphate 4-epimerase/fuculose-1-phosphate aldolase
LSEAVANHLSLAVSPNGKKFLINPKWMHFSRIRASDLLLLDADDTSTLQRQDAPDVTAWYLHGIIHARLPGLDVCFTCILPTRLRSPH